MKINNLPVSISCTPAHLQEIADSLIGFSTLLGEFGSTEVGVIESMEGGCRVPYGARYLHQPIAQQQHQPKQTPGVGGRGSNGTQFGSGR